MLKNDIDNYPSRLTICECKNDGLSNVKMIDCQLLTVECRGCKN